MHTFNYLDMEVYLEPAESDPIQFWVFSLLEVYFKPLPTTLEIKNIISLLAESNKSQEKNKQTNKQVIVEAGQPTLTGHQWRSSTRVCWVGIALNWSRSL